MKAEDELLNSSATENGTENGAEKNGAAPVVAEVVEKDPMEEEHTTDFEAYPETFFKNLVALKGDKAFNDGSLVFVSDGKRKRLPVLMSSIAIGSIKLNREFLKAKRTMMEAGYMNNTIDLMIPDFSQPDQSLPETAVRSLVKYIYTGTLDVSETSIRNITVLAGFLGLEPVLAKVTDLAIELGIEDFPLEELTTKGKNLGEMKVVGLDKFISAGFGNKIRTGDKRKNYTKNNKGGAPDKKKPKETVAESKSETVVEGGTEDAVEIQQTDNSAADATSADADSAPAAEVSQTATAEGAVGPTVDDTGTAVAADQAAEPAGVADEPAVTEAAKPVGEVNGRGKARGRGRGRGRRGGRGRGK